MNLFVTPLEPGDIAAVADMTFPAFRPHLARCLRAEVCDGVESVALVARDGGIPIGLVLAQAPLADGSNQSVRAPNKTAGLLSISVVPDRRQSGVASRLMLLLEDMLRQRGCVGLATSYTTRLPVWQPFERLLAACRWSSPEAKMLMSAGYCREVVKAPWLSAFHAAPPGFELFEWSQLGAGERAQLQHDVAAEVIPRGISPFADEEDIEPTISVGVRSHGEVAAWMIVTRSPFVPNALCYRSLFVRPQLRAVQALGPLVLAEAIRRHASSTITGKRPVGAFGMSFRSSAKMINFFRKRLAPFCFSTYESRAAMKSLV